MELRTVLVPLDGSERSEAALSYAETIARASGASLRLLSVVAQPGGLARDARWLDSTLERLRREAGQYLDRMAATLAQRQLAASVRVHLGDPVAELLSAEDEGDVDLLVMATRGSGGVERWLVGSVADKVMRLGSRPVLLVRSPNTGPRGRADLRRVLVPLDGSARAEAVLPLAADLGRTLGATPIGVQVVPWLYESILPDGYPTEIARWDQDTVEAASVYLSAIRERLPADLAVRTEVLRGRPGSTLAEFARDERVDLVIMNTHGRGGLARTVLGSTADSLVRSGVPTLLVRSGAVPTGEHLEAVSAG